MKKILGFIKKQIKEEFHTLYYITSLLLLSICMIINYYLDFSDLYIDTIPGFNRIMAYLLFYSFAYYSIILLLCYFKNQWALLRKKEFWIKSLIGLFILSLDGGFPYLHDLLSRVHPEIQYWAYKVAINSISILTVLIPLTLFHYLYDAFKTKNYGLLNMQFTWRPYLIMLLIMIPLLTASSLTEGFQQQYPMYKSSQAHVQLGVPEVVTVLIYELVYGFDFISVEYIFRGFFVIGMIHLLGRSAILPMASIYCFLHFGKPAGEAISSIFGGYLLGIIAYETASIWGGIALHVGIAWSMEIMAFATKSLFLKSL